MKILYITTIGSTMSFFESFLRELISEGHTVDIATNEDDKPVPPCYRELGCKVYRLSCSRSPLKAGNLKAIREIRRIVAENTYDIVHCHTPIAAACTRLACRKVRKQGTRVFYTAHGFHFFKGAPKKNWLIYYPIEKLCAYFTDVLITINHEDYALAKKKLKAKRVVYMPGVGIDLEIFGKGSVDKATKRKELGVPEDAFLLLSVGELNENKNHQVIIRALAKRNDPKLHYAIAGVGNKRESLIDLAKTLGVSEQVHLLGYRNDIPELNRAADVFCFPSCREGLGLAAIEAMACGLPLITSNVHGINDYSIDGVTGYKTSPSDVDGFSDAIGRLALDESFRRKIGQANIELAKKYASDKIHPLVRDAYKI